MIANILDNFNMIAAKQNQKFPFHFLSAPPTPPAEENKKGKENFWVLHTRVRERVRGALVRFPTQSEHTGQFQATTRSARAKSGVLLEMGSDFFKQTPPRGTIELIFNRFPHRKRLVIYRHISYQHPRMTFGIPGVILTVAKQ